MGEDIILIHFNGNPIVGIKVRNNIFLPSELLDWYAEVYDFPRKGLKWSSVKTIEYDIDKDKVNGHAKEV